MTRALALIASLFLLASGAAFAQEGRWYRAESANFIVYGDRSADETRSVAQLLEDFDTTLRRITSAAPSDTTNKLEVFLVRNSDALNQVRNVGRDAAGFYLAGAEQIAAFVIYTNFDGLRRNQVLFHEYAHHFMLHNYPHAYPRWYVEGFAEWISTTEIRDREARIGIPSRGRSAWIVNGPGLLPMEDLLAPERIRRREGAFWGQFYAHAWFATTFIQSSPDRLRGIQRYIQALGNGADPIEAFQPAFQMTPDEFERQLLRYRGSSVPTFGVQLPEQPAQVDVARLPRSADDLLLVMATIRAGVSEDRIEAVVSRAETAARAFPNDPLAEMALARVSMLRANYTDAQVRLEAIVAADDRNADARYLLARCLLERARNASDADGPQLFTEARRQLVRAFRANPDHFPTLYLYASLYASAPQPMTQEQLDVLGRALELAPQADAIRLTLARELIEAGNNDSAIVILRPLIYAPHGGEEAEQARALFDQARRASAPQ